MDSMTTRMAILEAPLRDRQDGLAVIAPRYCGPRPARVCGAVLVHPLGTAGAALPASRAALVSRKARGVDVRGTFPMSGLLPHDDC